MSMNGIIFDIKEFSIHDGPGGRFTVFMKGCPLRCVWCHNPEGLRKEPQLMHKRAMCSDCGLCKTACNHEECNGFDRCIHACRNGCLSVVGESISAEKLADRLLENTGYFEMMNGGITISGGEPLMQADFVCKLADKLKKVHKAIQTCGYADFEVYKKTIDKFDYVMQDIKLIDRNMHKKYTGVYNDTILNNIEYLKSINKEIVFRIPLIPEITDTEENLVGISRLVGVHRVELLPYNSMAGVKYDMLDMKYKLNNTSNRQSDFARYFANAVVL